MKKYTAVEKPVPSFDHCLVCGTKIGVSNYSGKSSVCSNRCYAIAIIFGSEPDDLVIFDPFEPGSIWVQPRLLSKKICSISLRENPSKCRH